MIKTALKLICTFILIGIVSCKQNEGLLEQTEYDGPIAESFNVETKVSDSARIKLMIKGPTRYVFQTGDYEYPDGVYIEFYEPTGKVSSTIKANRGYYMKKENLYKVEEDVEVHNFKNNEKLNSEELFWDPRKEEVYTEKFVNITTETKIIKGVGLIADQDFDQYQISKITGVIYLEEEF
jgi:LPS export ABC transporter protein LptC